MYLPIALAFGAGIANAASVPEAVAIHPLPSHAAPAETHLPMKLNSHPRPAPKAQAHTGALHPVPAPAVGPAAPSLAAAIAPHTPASLAQPSQALPLSLAQAQALYPGLAPAFILAAAPPAAKAPGGLSGLISSALAGFSNKLGRRSGKTSPLDSALYNLNAIPESGNGLDLNNIQALNEMIGSALNTYAPGVLPVGQATPTPAQVGLMNTISSFVSNNLSKGKKMFDIPKAFYKSLGERIIGSAPVASGDLATAASNVVASVPLKESIVSTIKSALSYLKPARSSAASPISASLDSASASGNLKRRTSDPFYQQNAQWQQAYFQQHGAQNGQFGQFQGPAGHQGHQGHQGQQQVHQGQPQAQQVSESQRQPQFVAQSDGSYQQFGYGNANELSLGQNGGYPLGFPAFVHSQPPVHKSSFYNKSKKWISGKLQRKHPKMPMHPQQYPPMMMDGQGYFPPQQQNQPQIPQQVNQQVGQQQPQIGQPQVAPQQPQQPAPPKSQLPSQTMQKVHNKLSGLPGIFNKNNEQTFIPLNQQEQQPGQQQVQPQGELAQQPQENAYMTGNWNQQPTNFFTRQPENQMFGGFQPGYQTGNGQQAVYNGPQVAGTVASSTLPPFATSPSGMNVDAHNAGGMDEHMPEDHPADGMHDQEFFHSFVNQAHHHAGAESVQHQEAVKPDASSMPASQTQQSQPEAQPQKAQASA